MRDIGQYYNGLRDKIVYFVHPFPEVAYRQNMTHLARNISILTRETPPYLVW